MKRCKSCQGAIQDGSANQSIPRIERLLRFHGMAAPMVKQVAKDSGPLCRKCLSVWSKDLSSN